MVPIRVPALRERPHDIRLLAEYFLEEFCARNNFKPKMLDEPSFRCWKATRWPGNARELRNVIERMAILTQGERLTRDAIPVEIRVQREAGPKSTIQEARESAEREHILRALEESNWNVSGAARALGMERTNLHKRIRALGLSAGEVGGMDTIGIIGVGLLGSAIAARLTAAGYGSSATTCCQNAVWAQGRRRRWPASAAPSCCACRLPMWSPRCSPASKLTPGLTIVDCTTGEPEAMAAMGAKLAKASIDYLDATVLGSSRVVRTAPRW